MPTSGGHAALAALDAITAEARRWCAPGPRPVHVGVSPLIGADVIARAQDAVAALPGRGGGSSLVLHEADLSELCTALDDGGLDLIVIPAVLPLTRYRHRGIGDEPVVLVESGDDGAGAPTAPTAPAFSAPSMSTRSRAALSSSSPTPAG